MEFRTLLVSALAAMLLVACNPGKRPAAVKAGPSPIAGLLKTNNLTGRVVLVEFGTIGCSLSGQGLDAMADWQRRKVVPDLAYLRLEANPDKTVSDAYYKDKNVAFPVVHENVPALSQALGTTVFPSFALLDKFGRVRYRGSQPGEKDLADWTAKLLAENADAGPNAPLLGKTQFDGHALMCGTRLPALSGKTKSLAEYSGKNGLLLVFVDTRCPFSARASAEVPTVAAALGKQGISILMVNITDPEAAVKKTYGSLGTEVVYDPGKETQQNWGIQFVPTVVLLDTAGQTIYRGSPVWADIATALEKKLNLSPASLKLDAQGTSGG